MSDKYNLGTVGSGIDVKELWSGKAGNVDSANDSGTITLSDNLSNYKFLVFDLKVKLNNDGYYYCFSKIISSQQFSNMIADNNPKIRVGLCWCYTSENDYFDFFNNSTLTSLIYASKYSQCIRILGIN